MINTKFELYKVKREIKRSGTQYTFNHPTKNKYGELDKDNTQPIGEISGIYHERSSNMYISITTQDAAQVRSKKEHMILCTWEDVTKLQLEVGDITIINNKCFNVTGVSNIQEWNLVAEINLEVVDNGS